MQKFYSDQVANNRFPDKVRKLVSEQQGSQARFPSRAGFQAKSRKKRLQGGSKQQVPKASFGSRAPDKVSGFGRRVPKKGSQVQLPKQCCTHGYPTLMQHCNNTNSFAISINLRINRSKKITCWFSMHFLALTVVIFFLGGIALHRQVAAQEGQKSAKILLLHACKRLLPAFSQL